MIGRFRLALVLAAAGFAAPAFSQQYPVKPVRVVIPWPPGGSNDIVGRIVAQKLGELAGQQFVIDNRGGAAGTIGSDQVAKAPPDGYTLMVHSATHVANPHLYGKLPYDTLKDFVGIAPISAQIGMLIVHPSLPVKNVKEFIALAKSRPGQLVYSSSGNGSFVHLTMALFAQMAGIKMTHIPYKGGGPLMSDAVAGHVPLSIGSVFVTKPHIDNKRLRPLAVTTSKRSPELPDVPTVAELGYPGFDAPAWWAVLAPAKTPPDIVRRMNEELNKALKVPEIAQKLGGQGMTVIGGTTETARLFIDKQIETWAVVVKENNIKAD